MSKLFTRILTTTAILSTVSVAAFAGNPMLEKVDTNKDGLVQLSEFTALSNQKFTKMDADGNGLVTKEERKAFHALMGEKRAKAKFAAIDSNGDGSVSEAEFMAARDARKERTMKRRDMNGDGQLDKEDRKARKKMRKKMRKKIHEKMKANKGEHKGNKHAGGRPKIDTNGDGAIDLAEHQAAASARFAHMDKNDDGVLSADEQHSSKGMRGKKHQGKKHGMRQ